jgi:hypothetical protein
VKQGAASWSVYSSVDVVPHWALSSASAKGQRDMTKGKEIKEENGR